MPKSIQLTASLLLLMGLMLTSCDQTDTDSNDFDSSTNTTTERYNQDDYSENTPARENFNNRNEVNDRVGIPPDNDTSFLITAIQGGNAEVQMGQLALEKSQHAEVKKFANMLVTDHSQGNQQLMTVANEIQAPVPSQLSVSQANTLEGLRGLEGMAFDKSFLAHSIKMHEKDIAEFREQASEHPSKEVRTLAAKLLPKLQSHLNMARQLNQKIK